MVLRDSGQTEYLTCNEWWILDIVAFHVNTVCKYLQEAEEQLQLTGYSNFKMNMLSLQACVVG